MKKYSFSVYGDEVHLNIQMILLTAMSCMIALSIKYFRAWWLWICFLVLTIVELRFTAWIRVTAEGMQLIRLCHKKVFLPWNAINHWGTISKAVIGQKKSEYIYFSNVPLISAPWEKMPKMTREFLYLTNQPYIKLALNQLGKKELSRGLADCMEENWTIFVRRRVIVLVIIILIHIFMLMLFYAKVVFLLPFVVLPAANILSVLIYEV